MKIVNVSSDLENKLVGPDYPYESKEEASIAQMLNTYGVPFLYKQPTLVIENGKRCITYADFFLPTYNGLSIDYIIESNSAIFRRKKNVYQDNQIPLILVSRKYIQRPDWQKKLFNRMQNTYRTRSAYRKPGRYG